MIYNPQVATRGAVLYFVLAELSSINYMYQWSLPWFMSTFISCIDPAKLQEQAPAALATSSVAVSSDIAKSLSG